MKARQVILSLLFACMGVNAWADDEPVIVIWLNDGSKMEIACEELPEFTYEDGVFTLLSEKTEISWPLEKLNKLTVSQMDTAIRDIKATGLDILSDHFAAYDLGGKLVKENLKSLSELPKGAYIIKDGRVTFKVVRK
jgi:hypothetical protein